MSPKSNSGNATTRLSEDTQTAETARRKGVRKAFLRNFRGKFPPGMAELIKEISKNPPLPREVPSISEL
ncbi:MAG: hypothetical protein Q7R98_02735 [Candidatus Jorgensenbacteria bacterium]|nr:hypothetical protein [Candidatus Jorgensenbacteria bacterium]